MSSDDDMPPPLEDMSEQLALNQKSKQNIQGQVYDKTNDHVEEVRLAPKKESNSNISVIKPSDDKPAKEAPKKK